MPPCSHSELDLSARSACAAVSSIVVAPSRLLPLSGRPWLSLSGIEASVVTSVLYGELTADSKPNGPDSLFPIPVPHVNRQPVIGAQCGCVGSSTHGTTA